MGPTSSLLNPKPQTLTRATNRWRRTYTGTTLSSGRRTYLTTQGVTLVPRPALLVGPSHPGSVPSASSTTCTTTISDLPYPPAKAGNMAKRRVGVEHSPSMLEPVRPGAVSPDRALCRPSVTS